MRSLRLPITAFLAIALATALPRTAASEDFTFNVRVEATNLDRIVARIRVNCSVGTNDGYAGPDVHAMETVGHGWAEHKFCPGEPHSFNGTIAVSFNVLPMKNAGSAKAYYCEIGLTDQNGNGWSPSPADHPTARAPAWSQVQANGLVSDIRGRIVRSPPSPPTNVQRQVRKQSPC